MTALFVDESKVRDYILVAVVVPSGESAALRKAVDALRMRGQRRVHFRSESDGRRRVILSALVEHGFTSRVYRVSGRSEPVARERCLSAVTADAVSLGATRLVLEKDDSYVDFDRRAIRRQLERDGALDRVAYLHERAYAEPLLWVPDAIAWASARGGDWLRRAAPLVSTVRILP